MVIKRTVVVVVYCEKENFENSMIAFRCALRSEPLYTAAAFLANAFLR